MEEALGDISIGRGYLKIERAGATQCNACTLRCFGEREKSVAQSLCLSNKVFCNLESREVGGDREASVTEVYWGCGAREQGRSAREEH